MMRSGPELPGSMRVVTLRNNVAFLIYLSIDEDGNKERAGIALDFNRELIRGARGPALLGMSCNCVVPSQEPTLFWDISLVVLQFRGTTTSW